MSLVKRTIFRVSGYNIATLKTQYYDLCSKCIKEYNSIPHKLEALDLHFQIRGKACQACKCPNILRERE